MSIQEQSPVIFDAPRPQHGEVLGLTFADAAAVSFGPYDTPEQRADRVEVARRLEAIMQPGVSVLHKVNELDIRGGVLLATPRLVNAPLGDGHELAIAFALWQNGQEHENIMRLRSLVRGTEFGVPSTLPLLAAGREGIISAVRHEFVEQWDREHHPDGLRWNDISPITQLRLFGALTETDVRLSDVLTEPLIIRTQDNIIASLCDPTQKHMHPDHIRALLGTAPLRYEDVATLLDYYLTDADPKHHATIMEHLNTYKPD